MTREEAIADIRDNIKPVVGGISLDMAIKALDHSCLDFTPKPINIFYDDYISKEDRMLLDGMRNTAYVCGCRGEDVEFMVHQALKRMGRDDLLPPCERCKVESEDKE